MLDGPGVKIFIKHTVYDAVQCNLTTKSTCVPIVVSSVLTCACIRIPCDRWLRCVSSLHSNSILQWALFCMGAHLQAFPLPSLPFPTVNLLWWVPVSSSMWGLMAQLPGFASHRSSLHLGAGCQWWKLRDVPGTQPPFSNAVVNY